MSNVESWSYLDTGGYDSARAQANSESPDEDGHFFEVDESYPRDSGSTSVDASWLTYIRKAIK